MKLTLEITCDNAAFEDDPGAEIALILRKAAARIEEGETGGTLRDMNGNTVGKFRIE